MSVSRMKKHVGLGTGDRQRCRVAALILLLFRVPAAFAQEPALLEAGSQPKFVTQVPNALDPSFIFQPDGTLSNGEPYYAVGAFQFQQNLGLVDSLGTPLMTTVWGYGKDASSATYPGRTFVAYQGQPTNVRWTNNLVGADGQPLPHLLPVDSTIHWADPLNQGHVPGPYLGPVPIVTHVHGGHTESASDGLPDAWFTPGFVIKGKGWKKELYHYDNDQEAGTVWYHDHALGITRLNVYAGLAGFHIIRDAVDTGERDNPLGLPAFPYEALLAIQDKSFTADGQLSYDAEPPEPGLPEPTALPEFFGDFMLVNGKVWPVMDVEPRKYRLRFVNGCDSRVLNIWITSGASSTIGSGPTMYQIGTDLGLLYAPVPMTQLTFAPGERVDLIVDFAAYAGQRLILRNNARTPYPKGEAIDPQTEGQIMAFRVGATVTEPDQPLPATLRPMPIPPLGPANTTRSLVLGESTDALGRLIALLGTTASGLMMWDEPISENPTLDATEIWELYNTTPDTHPIHQHLVSFQILDRQRFKAVVNPNGSLANIRLLGKPAKPDANEDGWKDTVQVPPGTRTRVIAKYDREGLYVWHCHIISHEDNEMMRPYCVGNLATCE